MIMTPPKFLPDNSPEARERRIIAYLGAAAEENEDVLRVIQPRQWKFPLVSEVRILDPDYEPPNTDALAA